MQHNTLSYCITIWLKYMWTIKKNKEAKSYFSFNDFKAF